AQFRRTGWTGRRGWTEARFVTSFPGDSFGVSVLFRNSGTGTVWIDDFQVEPLEEKKPVPDAPEPRPFPARPADLDTVLRWSGKGDLSGVLDESGYGHHGKLYGEAK